MTDWMANLVESMDILGLPLPDDLTPPAENWVEINDQRFFYLDWGKRGKPKLLFLHGGGQTAHSWDIVALALRPSYHVIAVDQRGHGNSSWPADGDYHVKTQLEDVATVVQKLKHSPAITIGLSMGGINAIALAADYPQLVSALVIVDVGPDLNEEGVDEIIDFMAANHEFPTLDQAVDYARSFNEHRRPEVLRKSLLHNLREMPGGAWQWKYDPDFPRRVAAVQGANRDYIRGKVAAIKAPTLVVHGADSHVLAEQDARALTESIPKATLVSVPQAGHTVPGDNPMGFVKAVTDFLAELGYK